MTIRRRPVAGLVLAGLAVACARIAPPPGGPPDFTPPHLIATVPESVMVLPDFDGWAEFRFDEVVSEGSQPNFGFGSGDLEKLVLISPDSGVPEVRWHRDHISVRPHDGWRPGIVYRVELAAGLSDIAPRRNVRDSAAVITFTTGAPLPTRTIFGRAVDWVARRFAPRALVEAELLPDSLVYRTVADSSGRFRIGPLPEGEYRIKVILDGNNNRRLDIREAWDTVRLAAGRDSVGEVWTFQQDTVPLRVAQNGATVQDSFALALNLTQPIDPALRLGQDAITLMQLPDSTVVPVVSAAPAAAYDSIWTPIDSARRAIAAARAAADSAAARPDSAKARPDSLAKRADSAAARPGRAGRAGRGAADTTTRDVPTEQRPVLGTRLVIRLNGALQPGTRYQIEVRGVRAMSGMVTDTIRTQLETREAPKPQAADSTAARPDSAAADTIRARTPADTNRPRRR